MFWKYDGLNPWAVHVESQTQFGIRAGKRLTGITDFELIPPKGMHGQWTPAELAQMKASLWVEMKRTWEQNASRHRLQSLIRTKLGGDNYRAANVISAASGKAVSARSIQAWLIEPTKSSSRTCPKWAVEALESYSSPEQECSPKSAGQLSAWEVKNRHAVRYADDRIEARKRLRQQWADTPISALTARLYELDHRVSEHLNYLNESLLVVTKALKSSSNFAEFQRAAIEELDKAAQIRFDVEEAEKALEQRSGEFSNDEGLPSENGG